MIMQKKIAIFTGTRAEYGLLYWLMKDIEADPYFKLKIIVSGAHLSPEFGYTWRQIENDGFVIDEKVEMLLSSNTPAGIVKSMGVALIGLADVYQRVNPDYIVILGDRYEALAAAEAAMLMKIPIVHLHGGEVTEGAYDDAIRHAITKLSYLHFTATETYRKRVIQLGEDPRRVFNVGTIGNEHLHRTKMMTINELGESLNFSLKKPFFIVTYHPVTLADESAKESFIALLEALDTFRNHQIIITYPNADDGGRSIIPLLEDYAQKNSDRVIAVPSLGQCRYLSAVKLSDVVIGNSSSGISEVPSLKIPTVNIGQRQKGRMSARSVINCRPCKTDIIKSINTALQLTDGEYYDNPYGEGCVAKKILDVIKKNEIKPTKKFYDL